MVDLFYGLLFCNDLHLYHHSEFCFRPFQCVLGRKSGALSHWALSSTTNFVDAHARCAALAETSISHSLVLFTTCHWHHYFIFYPSNANHRGAPLVFV